VNRNIAVILSGRDAGLARTLGAGAQTVDAFERQVEGANTRMQKMAAATRFAFAALAAVAVIAFGAAIASAVRFEVEMQNVETVAHAGVNGIRDMGSAVLAMATQLPQTTTTLARGLYDIASSGFQGADALNILEVSATAASAGLTTTAVASKAVVAVLNAYGLEASDAADVSDILFQTVELGVLTFQDLATQLGDVIGAAAAADIEFEEIGSALATMTLAGLSAAESTVSLNRLIQKLIQPSEQLRIALRKMGFESGAAALEQHGLFGTMELIRQATGGQITELIRLFPEIRAARGAYALMAAGGEHYARIQAIVTDEQSRAGATQRAFNTQMQAVGNQFRVFLNRVQVAGIELGTVFLPTLVDVLEASQRLGSRIGDALDRAADLAAPAFDAISEAGESVVDLLEEIGAVASPAARGLATLVGGAAIGGLTGLAEVLSFVAGLLADHPGLVRAVALIYGGILVARLGLAATSFLQLHAGLLLVRAGLAALTAQTIITRIALVAAALGTMLTGNFIGGAVALSAAVRGIGTALLTLAPGAAGIALITWLFAVQSGADRAKQQARELITEIEKPFDLTTMEGMRGAVLELESALSDARDRWEDFGGTGNRMLRDAFETLTPFPNEVADTSEEIGQLTDEIDRLQTRANLLNHDLVTLSNMLGISKDDVAAWVDELGLVIGLEATEPLEIIAERIRRASAAASAGTPATDAFIGALQSVIDPAATATDRVEALDNAIKGLIGTALSASNATIGWEQAIDDLTQAVVDNGINLDITTQEGRNVAGAINQAAEAAIDHAVAVAEQSGTIADGVEVLRQHRDQLVGQLVDLGLTRQAAEAYVNQLGLTPDNISTLVSLENAEAAMVTTEQFMYMLELVDAAESTATVDIDTSRFDDDAIKIAQALVQIELAAPEATVLLNGEQFTPTAAMVEAWALHWDSSTPEAQALLSIIDPEGDFATLQEAAQNWNAQHPQATAHADIGPTEIQLHRAHGLINRWNFTAGTATINARDNATGVIDAARRILDSVNGRTSTMYVNTVYLTPNVGPRRMGGIDNVTPAAKGMLQAGIVNQRAILFGERETGGEAFVPRFGNPHRSTAVLAEAASWYGMELRPRGTTLSQPQHYDLRSIVNVSVRAAGSITDQRGLVKAIERVVNTEIEEHDRKVARELASR
jgi:TP901 family phage tail tape measure protein